MPHRLLFFIIFILAAIFFMPQAWAQDFSELFVRAKVLKVLEEGTTEIGGYQNPFQKVELQLLSGPEKDKVITVDHGGIYALNENQKVHSNELVVVNALTSGEETTYWLIDKYRLNALITIAAVFFLLVILVSGLKGLGAIVGMIISLVVIVRFIVPQILQGSDPLLISLAGSLFILFSTMYFAHGYNRQTTLAVAATFVTLLITGFLSVFFVQAAKLTGMGTEEAYSLQLGQTSVINLKGLLLGGMIIGALGVLDDITTTQIAAIFQIHSANPKIKLPQLIAKGMHIGKEHVSSLVNTLVMAYAGASLPLFILFALNPQNQPFWAIVNSELLAEEIVRTLSGSFGLILAVPLSTFLSAWYISRYPNTSPEESHHHH